MRCLDAQPAGQEDSGSSVRHDRIPRQRFANSRDLLSGREVNSRMIELVVKCDCGWEARGPEKVLVRKIQEHARKVHDLEVSREQALAQTRPAS